MGSRVSVNLKGTGENVIVCAADDMPNVCIVFCSCTIVVEVEDDDVSVSSRE